MDQQALDRTLGQAMRAQQAGDVAGAVRFYQAALSIRPDHPAALNSLGVIALNSGDVAAAVDHHRRAAQADPGAPILWVNLAKAQRVAGDDEGERESLIRALAIDPVMFSALVRKAELHERLGEAALGLPAWQAVVATAPDNRTPDLDALVAHAYQFIRENTEAFASEIDAGLADARRDARESLRRFDACVNYMTGRRRIFTNVCAGTHFPFLPADEFFDRAHFPWFASIEAQTDAIRAELTDLLETGAPGFEPYVRMAPGTPENKWTPLDASSAWSSYYLWHYGRPVADAHQRCPATVAALLNVPQMQLHNRCPTAFFSILEPHTHIPPHTGVTNTRAIVHLPLIVPDHCSFRVGSETREWRIGEALAFDDTIEHEARNDSNALRAVLIFDVWNPHITETERAMLGKYFEVADASTFNPGVEERY